MKPNLFSFATSELSQDAIICWLLSWACPDYKETDSELHALGTALICAMFEKHNKGNDLKEITKICVRKQEGNIDVLCIINDTFILLIEDKIDTREHSDQLNRYREYVSREYPNKTILPIYYKTREQDYYKDIEDAGYEVFLREDILKVLHTYKGNNSIAIDYRDHLDEISRRVASYLNTPFEKWDRDAWVGFYVRLQKDFREGRWSDVNPPGGLRFLGFYWNWRGDPKYRQLSLHLEKNNLCFKIMVADPAQRRELRTQWHNIIKSKSTDDFPIVKPNRFGSGENMTVCVHPNYRVKNDQGFIDIDKTIEKLEHAQEILNEVTKNL